MYYMKDENYKNVPAEIISAVEMPMPDILKDKYKQKIRVRLRINGKESCFTRLNTEKEEIMKIKKKVPTTLRAEITKIKKETSRLKKDNRKLKEAVAGMSYILRQLKSNT